jgi:hypothetical protein
MSLNREPKIKSKRTSLLLATNLLKILGPKLSFRLSLRPLLEFQLVTSNHPNAALKVIVIYLPLSGDKKIARQTQSHRTR